uniref:Ubiquitin-like domain-containing protein n=1 Tax=Panagrolaimus sp. PS1159 TaxID=55785 RepID=A0AC35GLU6_9BILA
MQSSLKDLKTPSSEISVSSTPVELIFFLKVDDSEKVFKKHSLKFTTENTFEEVKLKIAALWDFLDVDDLLMFRGEEQILIVLQKLHDAGVYNGEIIIV